MKDLSFRIQCCIAAAIILLAFILGEGLLHNGIYHNIGFAVCGLLFVINPVWPKTLDCRDHRALKRSVRTGGIIVMVVFGFLIAYKV